MYRTELSHQTKQRRMPSEGCTVIVQRVNGEFIATLSHLLLKCYAITQYFDSNNAVRYRHNPKRNEQLLQFYEETFKGKDEDYFVEAPSDFAENEMEDGFSYENDLMDHYFKLGEEMEEVCHEFEKQQGCSDEILRQLAIEYVNAGISICPSSDVDNDGLEAEMEEVWNQIQFEQDLSLFLEETGQFDDAE